MVYFGVAHFYDVLELLFLAYFHIGYTFLQVEYSILYLQVVLVF